MVGRRISRAYAGLLIMSLSLNIPTDVVVATQSQLGGGRGLSLTG